MTSSTFVVTASAKDLSRLLFHKLVLSSPPPPPSPANDNNNYSVMAIQGIEARDFPDSSSPRHTNMGVTWPPRFPSVMSNYEKWLRSYCSRRRYLVESIGDLLMVIRYCTGAVDKDGNIIEDMLVNEDEDENEDSSVSLPYRTVRFDVYNLDRQRNKWSYISL
ncbi:hypothetical protein F0562_008718 [Nyssa sinensis]|uniref:KIB1-4 beta-propeller domain-containing protein n=1 Tax=Nyssa sinensis TaxID=561372 RepID=A0A5J5A817_9ASTE|nr:hypothetical protein F0562_008718 [Nyssa sinensis]